MNLDPRQLSVLALNSAYRSPGVEFLVLPAISPQVIQLLPLEVLL